MTATTRTASAPLPDASQLVQPAPPKHQGSGTDDRAATVGMGKGASTRSPNAKRLHVPRPDHVTCVAGETQDVEVTHCRADRPDRPSRNLALALGRRGSTHVLVLWLLLL